MAAANTDIWPPKRPELHVHTSAGLSTAAICAIAVCAVVVFGAAALYRWHRWRNRPAGSSHTAPVGVEIGGSKLITFSMPGTELEKFLRDHHQLAEAAAKYSSNCCCICMEEFKTGDKVRILPCCAVGDYDQLGNASSAALIRPQLRRSEI